MFTFRLALRTLMKDSRSTLPSVFALALGIGATTVIFGVVYSVLFNPFPYRASNRLVSLTVENLTKSHGINHRDWYTPEEFLGLRQQNHVFEDIAGYDSTSFFYDDGKGTHQIAGAYITGNTFEFYGVQPILGRPILPSDAEPGSAPVFVMSYKVWQREFNGDPKILDRTFLINDVPRTLIGIMPSRFSIYSANLWLPRLPAAGGVLMAVGRIRRGIALQDAAADIEAILRGLLPNEPQPRVAIQTLVDGALGDFKKMLYLLLAAVLMLLLIACSNVANLLLARATARRREIATRVALGARRLQILFQLLSESCILSGAGCILGCALAYFGLKGVAAIIPPDSFPHEAVIALNPAILAFALCMATLTTLFCGVAPAFHTGKSNLYQALIGSGTTAGDTVRQGRLRSSLVIAEVALSSVLLIGAGLTMHSLFSLTHVDLPFNPAHTLYVQLSFPRKIYYAQPDKKPEFFKQVLPRVSALPGIVSVAETWRLPPNAWPKGSDVAIYGRPDGETWQAHYEFCTEGYFQTLGLPLLLGRLLSQDDIDSKHYVAVVNQTLVQEYFGPDQDPIGQKIRFRVFDRTFLDAPHDTYFEIIGVVRAFARRPGGRRYAAVPEAFLPASVAGFPNPLSIVARTTVDPHSVLNNVYGAVWNIDHRVIFNTAGSIEDLLREEDRVPQFDSIMLSSFAGIGLLLAAIGIFSMMTYIVSLRTSEIGVRMALGAPRSRVFWMVLQGGMSMIAIGTLVGILASLGLVQYLKSQLWGISAADPWTFVVVIFLMFTVGLIACWLPARRATQVDFIIALRSN